MWGKINSQKYTIRWISSHWFYFQFHRYYAIVKPLKYPMTITKKVVAIMILNTWISPALLSFIPIFAGWYTTDEHKERMKMFPDECQFEVNKVYAVISSSISFWIPCTIMVCHATSRMLFEILMFFFTHCYFFSLSFSFSSFSMCINQWVVQIFTYAAIFREANRQEKQLAARQGNAMLMHRHSSAGGTNGTYGKHNDKSIRMHKHRN